MGEVRRVRGAYRKKSSQTDFKDWEHRATMSRANLRVAEEPMVSWLLRAVSGTGVRYAAPMKDQTWTVNSRKMCCM